MCRVTSIPNDHMIVQDTNVLKLTKKNWGSGHVTSDLIPLVAGYRTSIPANGRTGQFGSAASPTPVRNASLNCSIPCAYRDPFGAPKYNDRSVSSSGGYVVPSQHPGHFHL
ncbi:hypothetical protein C1H46_022950 [Malus baccata]|uniref:Uncharacterized protein n=1 Tax=Malus baccata TaxID=106549 RepID=A0A540LY85_MALBA|nr:hypothetical protein C1H46_022950 [Malus baccata]